MAISKTDSSAQQAPAYTDLAGLSKLKRAAGNNDPAAIRTVAQQFESMFTRLMLKSMRDAIGPDPTFGSDQEQMYQGMADDQLSIQLSKGKGFGLADMLVRQLQKMGVKGADAAAHGDSTAAGSKAPGAAGGNGPMAIGTAGAGAKAAAAYSATQRAASNSPTAASASTASSAASDAAKTNFVQDLWPQAQEAGQLLGVDPRHLIAQAALETNWGRNMPQDATGRCSNNLFGIKASTGWSGSTVTSDTLEYQDGAATNTSAQFKAYATPAQSFQDYVALLRNNPRYSTALNTGSDVQAFATGLQRGGYATDPDYASKIAAVANAVAHKVNDTPASVSDLKLSSAPPISANTGAL
ncbi:MAG: flagellar assembly peptidoglycan hydrolase FlgJ [Steroidobacteraceae bacterium]